MIKTTSFTLAFILFLAGSLSGQEALQQYLVIAAENNPGLRALYHEYQASLEIIDQVGSLPDPQLGFDYFIQPVETRLGPQQAGISLTQMFPWFGTLSARESVAALRSRAKFAAFNEAKSNLFFQIKSSYYELYFSEKAIKIMQSNLRILDSFRNLALIKVQAGLASGVDELRIEMEQAEMHNQVAVLEEIRTAQTVKFYNLLNTEPEKSVLIPDTLWSVEFSRSEQEILDSIKSRNPDLLALDFDLKSHQARQQLARKNGAPSLGIGLGYIMIGENDNTLIAGAKNGRDAIVFPKLSLTLPLYRAKYNAMVQEANLMQQAAVEKISDKYNALTTLYARTMQEYRNAVRSFELYQRQRIVAKKALQILEAEYAAESRKFEEILRMERRKLNYELEMEKARVAKHTAIAFIYYLMGS